MSQFVKNVLLGSSRHKFFFYAFGKSLSLATVAYLSYSYFEGIRMDTSPELKVAEGLLLKTKVKKMQYEVKEVHLPSGYIINTLTSQYNPEKENLVLIHGLFGGIAQWSEIYDELNSNYNIFALDMIGCGRSSRPNIVKIASKQGDVKQGIIDFYVDSFEEWRQDLGISKFAMVSDGFGSLFGAHYASKHPEHVTRVLMSDPVGIMQIDDFTVNSYIWSFLNSMNFTLADVVRLGGPLLRNLIAFLLGDDQKVMVDYFLSAGVGRKSADLAYMKFLDAKSKNYDFLMQPALNNLKNLNIPVRIVFGEDYTRLGKLESQKDENEIIVVRNSSFEMNFLTEEFVKSVMSFNKTSK